MTNVPWWGLGTFVAGCACIGWVAGSVIGAAIGRIMYGPRRER